MATRRFRTFGDILTAVREMVQIGSTDTVALNRIRTDINFIYQEVVAHKEWQWLYGNKDITVPAYISSGTVSVTAGSSLVTFSVAPTGSKHGYLFSTDDYSEIYRIESHTAGSTTAYLDTEFTGSTNATATYKIWTDKLPLPTDCKEIGKVWHDHYSEPLDEVSRDEFQRMRSKSPKIEGRPRMCVLGDFYDPLQTSSIASLPSVSTRASGGVVKTLVFSNSLPTALVTRATNSDPIRWRISGCSEPSYNGDILVSSISTTTNANDTITYIGRMELQESATSDTSLTVQSLDQTVDFDRYRELFIFPALYSSKTTLHVDYIKDVLELENDNDEPVIPKEWRSVLYYGALWRAWSRLRNKEEADDSFAQYERILAKMEGKLQENLDRPRFVPSNYYLNAKRYSGSRRSIGVDSVPGSSGGGQAVITGNANTVAVYDAQGELGTQSTVSTTELGYLDGVTSSIQTQLDSKMPAALSSGQIVVGNASNAATAVTPTGDVTISNAGVTTVASVGGSTAANVHAAEALANAATNANTASAIVKRDASGNFSAGTITATLSGAATSAGTLTGNLTGDVTSSGMTTSYTNKVPLAKGGTNADLSATGGTGQYLKQATLGGAVTVGAISASDVPTLNQNTTGTAANVTGIVAVANGGTGVSLSATGGTGQYLKQTTSGGTVSVGTISASDLPTIALTGNVTGSASGGSIATTIGAGVVTNSMQATMANNTVKGNVSGSTASPSDVTLASAATASSVMYRDSSANTKVNSLIENLSSTATAAGTTTLTVGSSYTQVFTGTSTQTVALPVASTLATNQGFQIINQSTGNVTVQTSGGNTLVTVAQNQTATVTCVNTAGGTGTASWSYSLQGQTAGGTGTVTSVAVTMPTEFSVSGSPVTSSGTVAVSKANQSANQIYAGPSSGAAAAPTFRSMALADLGSIINYYQGRTSSAASWTTTSTSYPGTLSNTGGNTLTQDAASGLTVTAAATSAPGITWTPTSSTAVYLIHASTCFFNGTQGANVGIRIWDGTTTIANGGGQEATTTGATEIKALSLMGIYAPGTASAVTVKLDMAVSAGTGHILDGSGQSVASITWTLVQIKN